jgi:uncharacterized protein YccT (UPF0319 family)
VGKNPKLAPTCKVQVKSLTLMTLMQKWKLITKSKCSTWTNLNYFYKNSDSEENQTFLEYNFNDNVSDKPLTRAHA